MRLMRISAVVIALGVAAISACKRSPPPPMRTKKVLKSLADNTAYYVHPTQSSAVLAVFAWVKSVGKTHGG